MQKRSKIENFVFTLVMAFVMVYAMVCYNIAIDKGGMSNEIFALAFKEIPIMWPIAVILEMLIAERLAIKLAFKIVTPKTNPAIITFTISAMIVCIMCPAMSFIATCLFAHPGKEIIAVWLQKWVRTLLYAFVTHQLLLCSRLPKCLLTAQQLNLFKTVKP